MEKTTVWWMDIYTISFFIFLLNLYWKIIYYWWDFGYNISFWIILRCYLQCKNFRGNNFTFNSLCVCVCVLVCVRACVCLCVCVCAHVKILYEISYEIVIETNNDFRWDLIVLIWVHYKNFRHMRSIWDLMWDLICNFH